MALHLMMTIKLVPAVVRRPFILGIAEGKWKPTLTHHFAAMLHAKGMLQKVLTQNIDGLDYMVFPMSCIG